MLTFWWSTFDCEHFDVHPFWRSGGLCKEHSKHWTKEILKSRCKIRLLKCQKEEEEEGKRLLNPSKCCNRTPGLARRPLNRAMWRAEQHTVDSTTVNLGMPDMSGQNFTGPPNGVTDVIVWSAWRVYGQDGPGFSFQLCASLTQKLSHQGNTVL